MDDKVITINSASELLSKCMSINATSNTNLYRDDFPTTNLIEGRIIFIKVPETNVISEEV